MPKGQLSRVPWPGNSWMPFTFQPTLWALQQPHNHSHSLQQAIPTELAHHYIQYALSTLSVFFFFFEVQEDFFKVQHGHIKAPKWHLKGLLATSKWHALLVYSGCQHGKM